MTHDDTPRYLALADRLGLDRDALERGETIRTTVKIASFEDFREIFGGSLTEAQRDAHSAAHKSRPTSPDSTLALLDELERHVYGRHTLSEQARDYAQTAFPISAKVMSATDLVISEDEILGPGGAPVVISCDTLTFSGGSIQAITTSLHITARELAVNDPGSTHFHIGILGEKGENGPRGEDGAPYAEPAKTGKKGKTASPGVCKSSGGDGDDGARGRNGTDGERGDDGRGSMSANVTIDKFAGPNPFIVFTESGAGGDGGDGGNGGKGQDGGRGGKGCDSGCTGTNGGNGGKAGEGGDGLNGGDGGRAVDAWGDIYILFPKEATAMLQTNKSTVSPGKYGNAGKAGLPGEPGKGGSGGKHANKGKTGKENSPGMSGSRGEHGKGSGIPANYHIHYF